MKKIFIFTIFILILPNLYAQNRDGLYTKETIEKLLNEGGFSENWKSILLSVAENIDTGNLIPIGDIKDKIIQNKINFNTPNEAVLYGALSILYSLYSYNPVVGVLLYNIVPSSDNFNKASERIRAFYAQIGILSSFLLQWEDLFSKEWIKKIAANNSYFHSTLKDYKTYDTLYSEMYELMDQTDENLSNILPAQKKLYTRNQKNKIITRGRNVIKKTYGDLVQKYPFSPLPHLIYFQALQFWARWQGGIYLEYKNPIDNLKYENINRDSKIEIQRAFDIKEIPLTMFYQVANMNNKGNVIEMYRKWLEQFDPNNLFAMGILISELSQEGRFIEAEARIKTAQNSLSLVPIGPDQEAMSYYFASINFAEMTLALYKEDYQRLAAITPKTIELSQDLPIILRKIAGTFSNITFMQKAGKQVGAKFYLDNFIQGGYKAAKRITEIYPESDYLAADIFNLSFYEFMRLDESDVAYQELVKIAENKLSMGKNTANQVKDLYYRIVKYYTPPGGVPEDVKKYFGVE